MVFTADEWGGVYVHEIRTKDLLWLLKWWCAYLFFSPFTALVLVEGIKTVGFLFLAFVPCSDIMAVSEGKKNQRTEFCLIMARCEWGRKNRIKLMQSRIKKSTFVNLSEMRRTLQNDTGLERIRKFQLKVCPLSGFRRKGLIVSGYLGST